LPPGGVDPILQPELAVVIQFDSNRTRLSDEIEKVS